MAIAGSTPTPILTLTCPFSNLENTKTVQEYYGKFVQDDLYDFVKAKGHLGDINGSTGTSTSPAMSYFPEFHSDFNNSIQNASVISCTDSGYAYTCSVLLGANACFVHKNSDGYHKKHTKLAYLKIGKKAGNLVTFYPIN